MESWSDWIQAFAATASTFATFVIVYYAKLTIDEGKRNRRKDTIENMLEKIYSPMYEILRRAKFGNDEIRQSIRADPSGNGPRDYVLEKNEVDEINQLIERYGHYLNPIDLAKLTKAIERPIRSNRVFPGFGIAYFHLLNAEIDPHFESIKNCRDQLRRELEELTRPSEVTLMETPSSTKQRSEVSELSLLIGGMSGAIISEIFRVLAYQSYPPPSWLPPPLQFAYPLAWPVFLFFILSTAVVSLFLVPIFKAAIRVDAWLGNFWSRMKRWFARYFSKRRGV